MIFVELNDFEQLSGILGFIAVAIAWLYGAIVLYKAIKEKQKILYYFFFTIIFTMSPWYPSGLGYIFWLFTRELIIYPFYVIIGIICVPFALLSWLQIYMPALHPKKKNIVTISIIIFSIAFYAYLMFFLFFAPGAPVRELIGIKRNAIDIDYKGFVLVFLFFSILVSTITGNDFSIASLKVEDPTIRWKGRFLIISFNLFAIGAIGDGILELTSITLIIFRSFMVLASTFYYIGFIMPKWMKRILSIE